MLTRNDKTVEDARDHISTALKAGVKHIGFKDVGVSFDTLNLLNEDILKGGATSYCLLYTSPSPRDQRGSRMPSSA